MDLLAYEEFKWKGWSWWAVPFYPQKENSTLVFPTSSNDEINPTMSKDEKENEKEDSKSAKSNTILENSTSMSSKYFNCD